MSWLHLDTRLSRTNSLSTFIPKNQCFSFCVTANHSILSQSGQTIPRSLHLSVGPSEELPLGCCLFTLTLVCSLYKCVWLCGLCSAPLCVCCCRFIYSLLEMGGDVSDWLWYTALAHTRISHFSIVTQCCMVYCFSQYWCPFHSSVHQITTHDYPDESCDVYLDMT